MARQFAGIAIGSEQLTKTVAHDFEADFALDWALKNLDLVVTDAGSDTAPWLRPSPSGGRGLVRTGSSGLDVTAARDGLGPESSGAS